MPIWLSVLNTVRHLTPSQAVFYALRRGLPSASVSLARNTKIGLRRNTRSAFPQNNRSLNNAKNAFTFLNVTRAFPSGINWCPEDVNRLWRYNLHYFDYLRSPDVTVTRKAELIDHWIEHNPQGAQPAWEPYTASLRITNWCKFFLQQDQNIEAIPQHWLDNLYLQTLWLSKNLEKHILANHYFENLRALAFAGLTLSGEKPNAWITHANLELALQLKEQFLPDGGHYERSPQYHAIVLEGCLDIFALTQLKPELFSTSIVQQLQQTLNSGLSFLATIVDPNGDYPLFGDSAYDSGPTLKALNAYAVQLGLAPANPKAGLIQADATGLFGYRHNQDWFLVDCGDIGPAYQPGHTHCDFLSFVLFCDGEHLIVDSGVCEYEPGEMRTYVRSTAAHNTVTIDDTEQSQVWGEFRVAKRAKRLHVTLSASENAVRFAGAYRGFFDVPQPITHKRRLTAELSPEGSVTGLVCSDQLHGKNALNIKQRLHLHPDVTVQHHSDSSLLLTTPKGNQWQLQQESNAAITLEPSWYCPEFGQKLANQCVVLSCQATLPHEATFSLKRV